MTLYLSNFDGSGKTDEQGHYKFQTSVFAGNSLGTDALKVSADSPASMSVKVATGQYIIATSLEYSYTGWNSSIATVSGSVSDPANPRITSIVLYVDKLASTAPSPPNNPSVTKLAAVNGTPSGSPSPPNNSQIEAVIGAGNSYIVLANITIGAGATTITSGNITDMRINVSIGDNLVATNSIGASAVTTEKINNSAITTAKLADSNVTTAKLASNAVTNGSTVISVVGGTAQNIGTTFTTMTNATGSFTSENGGPLLVIASFGSYKSTAVGLAYCRVVIGSTNVPNATGWSFYWNTLGEHQSNSWSHIVTGISAGTYSVSMQSRAVANSISNDNGDQQTLTIIELKR